MQVMCLHFMVVKCNETTSTIIMFIGFICGGPHSYVQNTVLLFSLQLWLMGCHAVESTVRQSLTPAHSSMVSLALVHLADHEMLASLSSCIEMKP